MTATKTNVSKINYNIKLLAGNNVVMVEASGYETEIFVPHIAKGRIGFLNVIPNRRCCQINSTGNKISNNNNNGTSNTTHGQSGTDTNKVPTSETAKSWRMTAGQEKVNGITNSKAISNHTSPSRQKHTTSLAVYRHSDKHDSNGRLSKALQITGDATNKSVDHSTQLYKIIRSTDTARKTGDYTPTHSFFPHSTFHDKSMSRISSLSANYKLAKNTVPSVHSKSDTNNISEVKWRKATVPSSSSSRRDNSTILVQRKPAVSVNRKLHSLTAIPSYIYSPTVPIKVNHKSEIRKRKPQSDKRTSNTSKSLKSHPTKCSSAGKPKSKSKKSNVSSKSQSNKSNLHISSFDLLQNANSMHHKQNCQYRKGCTPNASLTTQKFKNICPASAREHNSNIDTTYVCTTKDQLQNITNKTDLAMHSPKVAYRTTVL